MESRKLTGGLAALTMSVLLALSPGVPASATTGDPPRFIEAESTGDAAASADICDKSDRLLSYIFNANASVVAIGVVKSVDGIYDQPNYDRVLPVGQRTDSWGWKCARGLYIGDPGFCVDASYWTGSEWKYIGTASKPGLYAVDAGNGQEIDRIEIKARRC